MSELRRKAASRLVAAGKKKGGSGYTTPSKGSRNSSRLNTDDEDEPDDDTGVFSDDDWSVASGDTLDSYGTDNETGARSSSKSAKKDTDVGIDWREKLSGYLDVLSGERKNTSYSGREDALSRISKILSMKYAWRIIEERHKDFEDGIIRSLRNGRSSKETILACRVLSLLVVTDPENGAWYGTVPILKNIVFNVEEPVVKVACLHALGSVLFFSTSAGEHEREEILDYLLDIIVSDGSSIQAADNEAVVTATIQVFGFLASTLSDALEFSQNAVPALVDQLESSQVSVRMASGQVIALLYERYAEDVGNYHVIYSSEEEDEDQDEETPEDNEEEMPRTTARPQPTRKNSSVPRIYYDEEQLIYLLTQLSSSSSKRLAKVSRRVQHSMFRDILETVKSAIGTVEGEEHDGMGLMGSVASLSSTTNSNIHLTLKFEQGLTLSIDSWAAYLRLAHVRRILSHGLPAHYARNRVVRIALDPQGSATYERSRSQRPASGYESEGDGGERGADDEGDDPRLKEIVKTMNREAKRVRQEDIQRARNKSTKELFNRELEEWET